MLFLEGQRDKKREHSREKKFIAPQKLSVFMNFTNNYCTKYFIYVAKEEGLIGSNPFPRNAKRGVRITLETT